MEAKRKIKLKLYNSITIRKGQKVDDHGRVRWRSEPREAGGQAGANSLAGAVQYASAAG
jgi:hypothetical protein